MSAEDNLRRCFASQCDFCREGCASYIAFGLDSQSPRGKNRILRAYYDGRIKEPNLVSVAYKCMACGQCSEVCITSDGIYKEILELRKELSSQGLAPEQLKNLAERISKKSSAFKKKNLTWIKDSPKQGRIGYFPGCGVLAYNPGLAIKTLDVLRGLNSDAVPIVSQCCSSPLFRGGLINEAKKAAEQLRKEIEEKKVKTLISSCPGCTLTFREVYPSFFKDWRIKSLHISELLIKKGKKMKKAGVKESLPRIIYHDPCHLARGLDIVSQPRKILRTQGYDVLEFDKAGKESICCGAGGGVALLWPEEAKAVGERKIEEALDSGADVLATFCPLCEHALTGAARGRIEIKDIIELL